jgi:hypothetical protein
MKQHKNIRSAREILIALGLPRAQQNERSALCLLALLDLSPGKKWPEAESPLMGITPIMEWIARHYKRTYAPNTRETVRRQTIHQFVDAGIAVYNPDRPQRPVNSPAAVYQVAPVALAVLRSFESPDWCRKLTAYLGERQTLAARYARERKQNLVPVRIAPSRTIDLSPGEHSELIRAIVEDFAPRSGLEAHVEAHGKMPDVVLYSRERNWLLLVESVTSHGPVNAKRHAELARLFAGSKAGLVYVTAFPNRATMSRYFGEIAWETEVWVADAPSHLIHFNGARFLGPYL